MDPVIDTTPTTSKLTLLKKVAVVAIPVAVIAAGVVVLRNRGAFDGVNEAVEAVTEA